MDTAEVIDSCDVIDRITELQDELESAHDSQVLDRLAELKEIPADELSEDEKDELVELHTFEDFNTWFDNFDNWIDQTYADDVQELKNLKELEDDASGYCEDWSHGATLIREDYFEKYCRELCKDIGDLPRNMPDYIVIDWSATAENLIVDYTEVEYDGVTYLVR